MSLFAHAMIAADALEQDLYVRQAKRIAAELDRAETEANKRAIAYPTDENHDAAQIAARNARDARAAYEKLLAYGAADRIAQVRKGQVGY